MVGAVIQDDLRAIILRSRLHQVMLIADIKQMYRQILVDDRDTPLQRIFWRNSPEHPMQTFELKTVTYGTASAPFLATRVLQQLADDEESNFPEAAKILKRDVYVDDLFTGGSSPTTVAELRTQLDKLCRTGGFEFRKFASNVESVLDGVSPERRAIQSSVELAADQCIKTLGLHWEPAADNLRFHIQLPKQPPDTLMTKRIALSQIAQLFDPLGLVGPVIVTAKIFMQTLWGLTSDEDKPWGWDQPLPDSLSNYWIKYYSQLPLLEQLRIPRCVVLAEPSSIELHLFSDASEQAYGACAYLRSTDASGNVLVSLLTAKSKVSPLKKRSIPRLELCGALEAAQLYQKICSAFESKFTTFFWVDSTTVLAWLKASPSVWTTFVANRVSKIQLATVGPSWNHVAGQQNPADHISRGIDAETILACDLWWKGPQWLQTEQSYWPVKQQNQSFETQLESRSTPIQLLTSTADPSFIDLFVERFSSFQHMLRVTAFCFRYISNCRTKRTKQQKLFGTLSKTEIQNAESALIRLVQLQEFPNETSALRDSKSIPVKSRLRWFTPFLDQDGVMRVGGRLDRASLTYDSRHQILLPYHHRFSALLVQCYHQRNLHASPQLLIGLLRLRYWIIGARNLAKVVVHRCTICFRARPKLVEQFMAELPKERITATRPFTVTGVDYWGPIMLKHPHPKFIQALRRFVSRRGPPSDIYSDNGRNFLGAKNELKRLIRQTEHAQKVEQECADCHIRWHFNPPRASHFGGLWESAINSAQKHFVRVVRDHSLLFDDMQTLLNQIECCLNSRPLVPVSDDPTDFEPLTPGHFLDLWRRWHLEYLTKLQPRSKWVHSPVTIKENQLVLLKEENIPPMRWPTARVIQTHPGEDGIIRVVTLRTPKGSCTRPVSKICLLPIASSSEESNHKENEERKQPVFWFCTALLYCSSDPKNVWPQRIQKRAGTVAKKVPSASQEGRKAVRRHTAEDTGCPSTYGQGPTAWVDASQERLTGPSEGIRGRERSPDSTPGYWYPGETPRSRHVVPRQRVPAGVRQHRRVQKQQAHLNTGYNWVEESEGRTDPESPPSGRRYKTYNANRSVPRDRIETNPLGIQLLGIELHLYFWLTWSISWPLCWRSSAAQPKRESNPLSFSTAQLNRGVAPVGPVHFCAPRLRILRLLPAAGRDFTLANRTVTHDGIRSNQLGPRTSPESTSGGHFTGWSLRWWSSISWLVLCGGPLTARWPHDPGWSFCAGCWSTC
ncbi:uncharacterized protein LOC129742843 [Uranotaenia lowii]|uniref:uncharacterized protein LOC129742843 n=1 Tax=Uranotaenia lowii TaxID=190385 RepID=UPI00247A2CCB|nr:uncharacterized protein LOC129742843 [Uranotaenia lowii]